MRRFLSFAPTLLCTALLTACSPSAPAARTEDPMRNPLAAKQHFDDLGQTMVDMLIHEQKDLAKDAARKSYLEQLKDQATARSKEETAKIVAGRVGTFLPAKQNVTGIALLLESTLYLSVDFATDPGPALHLMLSKAVDPRDVQFPDASAVDLGLLRTEYGAQSYAVPKSNDYQTAVLYDTRLKRIYGFAQLAE